MPTDSEYAALDAQARDLAIAFNAVVAAQRPTPPAGVVMLAALHILTAGMILNGVPIGVVVEDMKKLYEMRRRGRVEQPS